MNGYKSFQDLIVWNKGIEIVEKVYATVKLFPKEECYALSDQMRRAAVSIPSNIAEGFKRNSNKDFINFLSIANGSNAELETQIIISQRLGYITETDAELLFTQCEEETKMLNTLIKTLKEKA